MRFYGLGVVGLMLLGLITGCGGSADPVAEKPQGEVQPAGFDQLLPPMERKPRVETPQEFGDARTTVEGFLKALSRRNESQVAHLLTTKARNEAASHGFGVRALGSETARFEIAAAKPYAFENGVQGQEVSCTWHDHDEQGAPQSFSASWLLKQEEGNWRVCGMKSPLPGSATTIVFNFEDFASMEANQRLAEAEMQRQSDATAQAGNDMQR